MNAHTIDVRGGSASTEEVAAIVAVLTRADASSPELVGYERWRAARIAARRADRHLERG